MLIFDTFCGPLVVVVVRNPRIVVENGLPPSIFWFCVANMFNWTSQNSVLDPTNSIGVSTKLQQETCVWNHWLCEALTPPQKKTTSGRNPFKVLYPPWNSPENGRFSAQNPEWGTWRAGENSGEGRCLQGGPPLWCAGNRYVYDSPFAPISIPSSLALFQKNGARSSRPNNTSCTRLTWLSLHLQAVLCWHFNQSLIHWVLLRRKTWLNMSKSNEWWWRHNNFANLFCDKNLWVWVWLKGTWVGFLPSLCEELQSSRIEPLVEKNLIH